MDASAPAPTPRFTAAQVGFRPVTSEDFPMLWEWRHRPHVEPWWESWAPKAYEASVEELTAQVAGTKPGQPYLVTVDGRPVGYIEGYRLSQDPEYWNALNLGHDAVGADVYIVDTDYLHQGLGPLAVGLFYLKMMDETGLEHALIDPETRNKSAIRAYEKAGFTFHRDIELGDPPSLDHIMLADRSSLEAALRNR
jgi:aminoglycoside 6'-N-acetyltransferase